MEYTKEDIIFLHDDKRVNIGDMIYYSTTPHGVLEDANSDTFPAMLVSVSEDGFVVEGYSSYWPFIIVKKKPEYVPFENSREFIQGYQESTDSLEIEERRFFNGGVWLKDEFDGLLLVTRISDTSLNINYFTYDWDGLMKGLYMPDGSPCGKKEE